MALFKKDKTEPVQPAQASASQTAEPDPLDRSKRLFSVGEEFDFKTRREMRQENRRAEEERRAAEQAATAQPPLSPYAQGHAILYGDRPASAYMNGFTSNVNSDSSASDWYKAHMAGGSVSSSPRSRCSTCFSKRWRWSMGSFSSE